MFCLGILKESLLQIELTLYILITPTNLVFGYA